MSEVPCDSSFYVYGLIDPRNDLPFYVGKGKGNRARSHISKVANGRCSENLRKDARIQEILDLGLVPAIVKYAEGLIESDAYQTECDIIKKFGCVGVDSAGILLNYFYDQRTPQNTGRTRFKKGQPAWNQGTTGRYFHTEETKSRMSVSRKGYQNAKGSRHSEESRQKRSEHQKGRQLSEETKAKIKASCKLAYQRRVEKLAGKGGNYE